MNNDELYWHEHSVSPQDRWKANGHRSCVIWFTGLSASGKSTIANAVCRRLHRMKLQAFVLDGDNIRHGLNRDLGFSEKDRKENIRRIGEVAKLFVESGQIVLAAFISPYREDRAHVRALITGGNFIEVYVKCPLTECERRDPKGIYRKALAGRLTQFTGISAPYETPDHPELILETDKRSIDACAGQLLEYLHEKRFIGTEENAVCSRTSSAKRSGWTIPDSRKELTS